MTHAVDGERARPTARLLEMPLAHRARGGGRLSGAGAAPWLAVRPDGGREGVEAQVERNGHGVRRGLAPDAGAGLHLAVGGQPPRLPRLEHLVRDRAHLEHGVHHLALLLEPAVLAQLAAGEPQRQADVHRALVGADADA